MDGLSRGLVLVTGADGFIGSHLVERLLRDGVRVRALCMYTSNGSHGWLDELDPALLDGLDVRLGDIRDSDFVAQLVDGVDTVFHLAALIAIPYSYLAPRSFIDTNVVGTHNVLEAVRRHGVRRMVHTSTSEVYGTPDTLPITEAHPLRGQSPYSASKIAADKLCEAWACSFDTPVVVLRPFNTYGPRQSARAIIPTLLGQILAGVDPLHLGSLEPRRDFTYVGDTVDGFVRAGTTDLTPGEVVQLGTGDAVSIGELVERAGQLLDAHPRVEVEAGRVRPRHSEVMVLQSDPRRAAERLGWRPSVDLDAGLRITAEWLRGRIDPRRVAQFQR
jgi:NAD dependent epimerase/dehydratase